MNDIDWWRSDEAKDARAANYLSCLLFASSENRREDFNSKSAPEWPAIFHYDAETDAPFWVECKSPVHAKDFWRGCRKDHRETHINEAARKLAA